VTTVLFRLLKTPIDAKGDALAAQIAALNDTGQAEETYTLDPADFVLIPGSPFAYWVSDSVRQLFIKLPRVGKLKDVRQGLITAYDFRFIRAWWEVPPECIGYSAKGTRQGHGWVLFAKGGAYSPYYADVHLVVNWWEDGEEICGFVDPETGRLRSRPQNTDFYFRPGLTWPLRTTSNLSIRALPSGCIFGHKGPSAYVPDDDPEELLALLAVMNSVVFESLVKLQLGAATAAARSYEVGVIQRTPIPADLDRTQKGLSALAHEAYDLQCDRDRTDETTHAFCLPALVSHRDTEDTERSKETLCALCASVAEAEESAQARLTAIQAEIDDTVFDLYGLSEADRTLVREEMGVSHRATEDTEKSEESLCDLCASVADEDEPAPPEDLPARVQNLLMWCVGAAFGRWDARMALDPTLLPALQGPFDPLPRCAPGALVGSDGLPPANAAAIAPEAWLRARENVSHRVTEDTEKSEESLRALCASVASSYPLPIAWDGILVDDPTHPSDIVARVREVLALVWQERADAVEREACEILGVRELRDYFRDPRRFFAFHIKRYSKSRRKAPIYWLLQSERRNYAIWLYVHRLRSDGLFVAGRDYADAKVALEGARLEELRAGLEALDASARRRREREIERQQKLVAEVTEFRDRLDRIALLNLPPDLNDGVTISIAPLWELVPWMEAQKTWEKLAAGQFEWSTMARQMRQRGLVR